MSVLAKLNLRTVHRVVKIDPVTARRNKLLAAIEEQGRVLAAMLQGEDYTVAVQRMQKDEEGNRAKVSTQKRVRAWFFAQDGGWYVQCKYGVRVLPLADKANAVFVKELAAVRPVLEAFYAACAAGEFDKAVAALALRKAQ